ncbi:unnamed protein product [Onchocerca ochengi]|uniref:J domain-containing protein n=1 Tax=Onchocerca ochengi TaxID=42157 RepID=A0A182EDL7_ONCOC|nr:unnamed protein product [Onchocerca ochengi]
MEATVGLSYDELHPDRKDCSNNQEVKRRSDAFVELTTAYEVLKVPERRQSYDMSLDDSRIFTDWTEGSRKSADCVGRSRTSADCVGRSRTSADSTESSSFDGLFAHSQYINRKKQAVELGRNILWILAEFWCLWRLFKIYSAISGCRSNRRRNIN